MRRCPTISPSRSTGCIEACEALGVPILTVKGYEADDVIGTVATRAVAAGFEVAIVSIDKDFFQLVRPGVRVYDPREDGAWFDEAGVVEKFGVKPSQVVDVLALVGDTSDNVAGVPGIGKKGAIDLVTQFGGIDALLARAAELKPKQREALTTNREAALHSRELVTIRCGRAAGDRLRVAPLSRAHVASAATSCSRGSSSAPSSPSTRRPRTRSRRTTRS